MKDESDFPNDERALIERLQDAEISGSLDPAERAELFRALAKRRSFVFASIGKPAAAILALSGLAVLGSFAGPDGPEENNRLPAIKLRATAPTDLDTSEPVWPTDQAIDERLSNVRLRVSRADHRMDPKHWTAEDRELKNLRHRMQTLRQNLQET